MQKFIKNNLFGCIISGILFGSIGVGATLLYNSNQISYTPNDSAWEVNDVKTALDDLYGNLKDGILKKTYQIYKHENNSSTTLTLTIPEDCKEGFLVVERYGYNSSDVTITITDSSGMKTYTQLLSNYGYGISQSAPISVWYAEFVPNSTITIQANCPSYALGTTIGMILY